MSLLVRLAFFDGTGPGDGRLTAGGADLTEGALLGSVYPRIADQLPHLEEEEDLHLLPRETEREMESGLALVDRKSLCNRVPPRNVAAGRSSSTGRFGPGVRYSGRERGMR